MADRRSDPPPPQGAASSWLVGALDQRTDLVPPAWPAQSASHRNVVQLPAVSDELVRALRARGPKRPASAPEAARRGRYPTPRSLRLDAAEPPPSVHVVGPAVAPVPAGPTRPSAEHAGQAESYAPVDRGGWAPPAQPASPPLAQASGSSFHAQLASAPRQAPPLAEGVPSARGLEHPVVVGSLLLCAPPIGLALLWASRAYGREAKIALTGVSAMMMLLAAAFGLVLLAR